MKPDPFWSDRFHLCALAAGFLAASEGRLDDSGYVKGLAYGMFESGAFAGRAQSPAPVGPRNSTVCLTGAARGACCDATKGPPTARGQRTDNPKNGQRVPEGSMSDWQDWERAKVIEMKKAGKTNREIAAELGKKASAAHMIWVHRNHNKPSEEPRVHDQ